MLLTNKSIVYYKKLFDEYEYHKFDESNGVDKFLKDKKITYNLISTNFYAPTAYIVKSH